MKESDRERMEHRLREIEEWRASGMALCDYAQQTGESLLQWRGKLSWEKRWRMLLQGQTLPRIQRSSKNPVHAFVKVQPDAGLAHLQNSNNSSHLRIILSGSAAGSLQAQIDWPIAQLERSSQWLREVLA